MRDDIDGFLDLYDKKSYIVYDVETTLIDKDKSVYAYPPEFILAVGLEVYLRKKYDDYCTWYDRELSYRYFTLGDLSQFIVVGHNLTFDLLVSGIENPAALNGFYWDTAIAEYEMYAQGILYPSLQDLADKYCPGEYKESTVSEMIKSGVCPKDIPKDMLEEYCKQDVNLTNKIFIAQMERFKEYPKTQQNLILQRMKYRMVTHEMSCNGMMMDREMIDNASGSLASVEGVFHASLVSLMSSCMPFVSPEDINPNSSQQLAGVLFGVGTYKVKKNHPTGEVYKSGPRKGEPKTKIVENEHHYIRSFAPKGILIRDYSTSEESLLEIQKSCRGTPTDSFIELILGYRKIVKERVTYFKGYSEIARDGDPYISIHTEFKHTATPTGRISSAKPNIQNLKSD